ncbi:MAG: hypothetical protein Q9167_006988 [Letrouitia subvulpina]
MDNANADWKQLGSQHDTAGYLHFYQPPKDDLMPAFVVTHPSGAGQKNYKHDPVLISIRDIRHREALFSLDRHSFAAVTRIAPPGLDSTDDETLKQMYALDAVQTIFDNVAGSTKVVVFDKTIRRATPSEALCRPVRKVHIDQTPSAAMLRAEQHLSKFEIQAISAGKTRVRLINVWRPLESTVTDHPLAFAESNSIEEADLVKVKHVYPNLVGETFAVKHNPGQRFCYWSLMTINEALLLQCYDSRAQPDESGHKRCMRCAHASFTPLTVSEKNDNRQSIEVRCLVLAENS